MHNGPGPQNGIPKNRKSPYTGETSLQVSYSQQAWWFLDQLEPGCLLGNLSMSVRILGPLNRIALERALDEVFRRHTILRSTFSTEDGLPKLFVAPPLKLAFPLIDLQNVSSLEREQAVQRLVEEESHRPFDLAFGPLLRTVLVRLADEEHLILLTLHRIIADDWSIGLLVREIGLLIQAFSEGKPSPLADPPIQYSDFAAWQQEQLQKAADGSGNANSHDNTFKADLAYWKEQLANMPARLELRADNPQPGNKANNGEIRWFELPPVMTARLKDLGKAAGFDLFTTLLAAFEILLYDFSGQEIFSVGSPVPNRNQPELENVVGPLENLLVLRADLSGDPTFRELIQSVQSIVLDTFKHQEVPFEKLVEDFLPEYNPDQSPFFQVQFSLQEAPSGALSLGNLTFYPTFIDTGTAMYDLSLSMLERNGQLMGALKYNVDLFNESTIQQMILHFKRLLDEILANSDLPISRWPFRIGQQKDQDFEALEPGGQAAIQREGPGLPTRRSSPPSAFLAPRNEAEAILAGIWKAALGVEKVGVHENFFTLGGNPRRCLQLIQRAGPAGLHLTPRQVYQNPTIAGQAAIATQATRVRAEQGRVQGTSKLTPAQHWFFQRQLPDPQHWNESVLLEGNTQLQPEILEKAFSRVISHHDALRQRFPLKEGGRDACYASPEELTPFTYIDLRGLPPEGQSRAGERLAAKLQSSLDIEKGPLLKAGYFDLGPDQPGRLLLVAHQLVIDNLSWQVLLEDLESIYDQLLAGGELQLPYKTTSYKYWANKLAEYGWPVEADSPPPVWFPQVPKARFTLPVDWPEGDNLESSAEKISVSLNETEAQAFRVCTFQAGEAGGLCLLLMALFETFTRWSGQGGLLVDLEEAGRDNRFEDINLSRTVGRFASFHPLLLDFVERETGSRLRELAKRLGHTMAARTGHPLLPIQYRDLQDISCLPACLTAQVCLRFTGQAVHPLSIGPFFRMVAGTGGPVRSRMAVRTHEWLVTGSFGEEGLLFEWIYSGARYRRETAECLAAMYVEALRDLMGVDRGWAAPAELLSLRRRQVSTDQG